MKLRTRERGQFPSEDLQYVGTNPRTPSSHFGVPGVQQQIRETGLHYPLPPPSAGIRLLKLLGKCILICLGVWDSACPQGLSQLWAVP